MAHEKTNKLDAATLGKIVLARFLTMPLKAYDRCVAKIESSPEFSALGPWMTAALLDDAKVIEGAVSSPTPSSAQTLGEIRLTNGQPIFVYHRPSFVREYLFDETGLKSHKDSHGFSRDPASTLHRLRLINSRNRLTHALIQGLLDVQADYLRSGHPLSLVPLPQARMSGYLAAHADLPLVADASRISRLIRGLSFRMADGRTLPLGALFPRERQLHCHRVDFLIQREKTLILERRITHPLSDEGIAKLLKRQHGISVSRRTVAAIRHQLAIPDWRRRGDRKDYLVATEGFSPLLPLTPQALAALVPTHPGVYEIRSTVSPEEDGMSDGQILPPEPTRVVYIGSTRDLRKRLADHLRGSSGNLRLSGYLLEGVARVRFRVVNEGWREVERQLYRVFCETFGAPPPCNRMSP